MSDSTSSDGSSEDGEYEAAEGEPTLSDELVRKWDPDRLLKSVSRRAGKGQRLDESTRLKYEAKFGADLSGVRVYSGEFAEEITRAHRAEAVTIGTTGMILMGGAPEHSMAGADGHALLAHELTHVAQAQRGVHRSASFDEATPLATEEHEEEAQQAESSERQSSAGDSPAPEETPGDQDKNAEEKRTKIMTRVLEMIADDQRVHTMRNGPDGWRP